ncbi:MAG: DNA-processing protein DprA [Clostridia bacterium]|nr:DNA-processing protein DprA [Clostridia bacterium]
MKYSNEELCLIWLDSFLGLEYKHKQYLYNLVSNKVGIKAVLEEGKDYIMKNIGENPYKTLLNSANDTYLKFLLDNLDRKEITVVSIESDKYPKLLKDTDIPPLVLYTKGNIDLLNSECFSIVGSRKSLPFSKNIAKEFSNSMIDAGFTLVTGIAQGIDQTVLECAVNRKASAISVIASGFDNFYPSSNKSLCESVIKTGLAITEHAPEVKSMPYLFPVRNRIIAGLSKGTLVVSGSLKSGTFYTAEYTEQYGRDLFAIPYRVGIESGMGCNDLIKKGAMLVDSPKDILNFYNKEVKSIDEDFSKEENEIISILKDGEKHIDKICQLLNKRVFEIMPILSMLEIKGVISKNGVNIYGLIRNDLEA